MNKLLTDINAAQLTYGHEDAHDNLPPAETGIMEFEPVGDASVGIWEIKPGTARFEDEDEVFVVITGSATLSFSGGESIEVGPGSVVRLYAGQQTVWTVRETLRKFYVSL